MVMESQLTKNGATGSGTGRMKAGQKGAGAGARAAPSISIAAL